MNHLRLGKFLIDGKNWKVLHEEKRCTQGLWRNQILTKFRDFWPKEKVDQKIQVKFAIEVSTSWIGYSNWERSGITNRFKIELVDHWECGPTMKQFRRSTYACRFRGACRSSNRSQLIICIFEWKSFCVFLKENLFVHFWSKIILKKFNFLKRKSFDFDYVTPSRFRFPAK